MPTKYILPQKLQKVISKNHSGIHNILEVDDKYSAQKFTFRTKYMSSASVPLPNYTILLETELANYTTYCGVKG